MIDIAFGTWKIDTLEAENTIVAAIEAGYRHFDTAAAYANENAIGEALMQTNCARETLFISGKLWVTKRAYDAAIKACKRSLKSLQLEYLDQYLIHWPATAAVYDNWQEVNAETWRALETLKQDGLVRSIGLCNFMPGHIDALLQHARIAPAVNQIEYHPGFRQADTVTYCMENQIDIEAWSSLGNGSLLNYPVLQKIADDHHKNVAQICLRWCIQHQILPITKTVSFERMMMNRQVYDFELSGEEMLVIDSMPIVAYSGLNPDTITQFG